MIHIPVSIQRLTYDVILPAYAKPGDAGMDVFAVESAIVTAYSTALIRTGFRVAVPDGFELQVRPKSGLALKFEVTIGNTPGTIDSGYRGEVGIILSNQSARPFQIEPGMKIAQLVLAPVYHCQWIEVAEIGETARGAGGFGSTGLFKDESHSH